MAEDKEKKCIICPLCDGLKKTLAEDICGKCLKALETLFSRGVVNVEIKLKYEDDSSVYNLDSNDDGWSALCKRLEAISRNEIEKEIAITERIVAGYKEELEKAEKENQKYRISLTNAENRVAMLKERLQTASRH